MRIGQNVPRVSTFLPHQAVEASTSYHGIAGIVIPDEAATASAPPLVIA